MKKVPFGAFFFAFGLASVYLASMILDEEAPPAGIDSVCQNCGFRGVTEERVCPSCGSKLRDAMTERVLGGTMAFLGLAMAAGLALVFRAVSLTVPADKIAPVPAAVKLLFFLIFAAGGATLLSGGWQAVTAKRNRPLHYFAMAMLCLAALGILFGAFLVRNFVSQGEEIRVVSAAALYFG